MDELTTEERDEVLAYLAAVKADLAEAYKTFSAKHPKLDASFGAWYSPADLNPAFRTAAGWHDPRGRLDIYSHTWKKHGREFFNKISEAIP